MNELQFLSEKYDLQIECSFVETGQEFCGKFTFSQGELINNQWYQDSLCLAGVYYLFGLDGIADHYILFKYSPPRLNDTFIALKESIDEWNAEVVDIPLHCPTLVQIAGFIQTRDVELYLFDGTELRKH